MKKAYHHRFTPLVNLISMDTGYKKMDGQNVGKKKSCSLSPSFKVRSESHVIFEVI